MSDLITALSKRHSQYSLTGSSSLSDQQIVDLVEKVATVVPSAFNSQSQRAVVLFGAEHAKVWDIVKDALRKVAVSEEAFQKTEAKIDAFAASHATILFFDDSSITQGLVKQFPLYAANFPLWAQQSLGMLQLSVWTALSEAGLGASLQHYNPLIDEQVHKVFDLPESWTLYSQMPFGDVVTPAEPKPHVAASEQIKVLGL